jgi:hypothetical protein
MESDDHRGGFLLMRRPFLMWPNWDDQTERQYQRYGCSGLMLPLAGTFIGMPSAFLFLSLAMQRGGITNWILGLACLLLGLIGMGHFFFGYRTRPGRLFRTEKDKID